MVKVFLVGNVTYAPETKMIPSGATVTTFSVAVNRKDKTSGQKVADFYKVSAWRTLGELCSKYLVKGSKCAVVGELAPRLYDGRDGKTNVSLEVTADSVEFLSNPKEEPQQQYSGQTMKTPGGNTLTEAEYDPHLGF